MDILFITNLIPYPTDNGGKIKTYNTLKILSQNNNIDLVSFYEDDKDLLGNEHLYQFCRDIECIKKPITTSKNVKYMLKLAVKNLLSPIPLVVYKYKDYKFKNLINDKLNYKKYDVIYIDHLQLGIYYKYLKNRAKTIILDEHNAESLIIKRKVKEEKNIIKKIYLQYEYMRLKKFEADIVEKVDKVIVLSNEDQNVLQKISKVANDKFIQIPIPVSINYEKQNSLDVSKGINILFLGTLSWYPNAHGIEWFIKNTVPLLDENNINYKLYVVGKDPSENLIKLCETNNKIVITGFVDDVNEYIENCDFMVVPLFIGGGMRVKILEGMGKNIPIISTTIGAEGIDIQNEKSILIANNEKEFVNSIKAISNVEKYEMLRKNAKIVFEEKYSVSALEKLYIKSITSN